MTDRKNVCIVAPGHWLDVMGGAQYQTMLLVRALADSGRWNVSYVARFAGDSNEDPADHKLVRIGDAKNREIPLYSDHSRVLEALRKISPDVVYHRGSTPYAAAIARFSRESGARVVWHVASDADVKPLRLPLGKHAIRRVVEWLQFRYSLRHTDKIVTQTTDQAALLYSNFGLRNDLVVYNFHPFPTEALEKSEPPIVAWIGNLKPIKQPEAFVHLAQGFSTELGARFVMVGQLQGSSRWKARIMSSIQSTPSIEYRGPQSQEAVNALLAEASLLVNTSKWEGFSNTFIQAWMRRVPVVSLSVNPDGLLSSGQIGVCAHTECRLAEEVARLVRSPATRREMGLLAEAYALERHSLRNISSLLALLDSLDRRKLRS